MVMRIVSKMMLAAAAVMPVAAQSAAIPFSSAVASFNQTFDRNWSPSEMIDGVTFGSNGWAIYNFPTTATDSQNSLLSLATPLAAGNYTLTFTIVQNYGDTHTLGDFALGYTTGAVPTLASGFNALTIIGASSTDLGTTFTPLGNGELLVSGSSPTTAIYTIVASLSAAAPVTGIFLNPIAGSVTLPTFGPGRAVNGNFVVSEVLLDAVAVAGVPEPATWSLMLAGFGGVGIAARRRRTTVAT